MDVSACRRHRLKITSNGPAAILIQSRAPRTFEKPYPTSTRARRAYRVHIKLLTLHADAQFINGPGAYPFTGRDVSNKSVALSMRDLDVYLRAGTSTSTDCETPSFRYITFDEAKGPEGIERGGRGTEEGEMRCVTPRLVPQ
ncbi:hypothetical protein EVAR_51462_1 [Eumeta japonica]|uniref:Uncharacterized protein n=1 Tax=Eumeta variegata TaxID=151549 RepID=A0A4C1XWF3_EUMVA|nr:hypothetical protein EVAR_51462_1 [Eumeta japonica]